MSNIRHRSIVCGFSRCLDRHHLVTRGEYRLSTAAGDKATGTLVTTLYGNDWMFAAGHQVLLQITQDDSPYLRPDNEPSTIDFTAPRLVLPIRAPSGASQSEVRLPAI